LGNGIGDLAQLHLMLPYPVFGTLSVIDIDEQHVSLHDSSVPVSQGQTACLKPTIHAIRSTVTKLMVIRLPGLNRRLHVSITRGS
jgi:hypothetical protein